MPHIKSGSLYRKVEGVQPRSFGRSRVLHREVAEEIGTDLDQLLAQAGERPRLRRLGHRQRPHEIAEVVSDTEQCRSNRAPSNGCRSIVVFPRPIEDRSRSSSLRSQRRARPCHATGLRHVGVYSKRKFVKRRFEVRHNAAMQPRGCVKLGACGCDNIFVSDR